MLLLALALTLTFNKPVCISVPCDLTGTLLLTPHEYNRELVVEAEGDRPSAKPLFRSYTVTLDGTEKKVNLLFTFKGPGIYTVTVTLKRMDKRQETVTREFRVAVDDDDRK